MLKRYKINIPIYIRTHISDPTYCRTLNINDPQILYYNALINCQINKNHW